VTAQGLHRVDARGADRASLTFFFSIDTQGPTITIVTPADNASYILGRPVDSVFYCDDASGVATCAGPATLQTGSVGTKTFTVTATDTAGHTSTKTHTYRVVYDFRFLPPIIAPPYLNALRAGLAGPINFTLGGNQGLQIFLPGYPQSQRIDCSNSNPIGPAQSTTSASTNGLTYDATIDQYTYAWKTEKAWVGTCRRFFLGLRDGSGAYADFRFTR